MFTHILELCYLFEISFTKHIFNNLNNFTPLWERFQIEWFVIQIITVYTFIRFVSASNYFKQLLHLLFLIILLACYVSLMQLELFACFMFIAEFTIVIFFYTLFLHLKIAINQRELNQAPATITAKLIGILLLTIITLIGFRAFYGSDVSLLFLDIYSKSFNFTLSDLNFFFYTITRNNITLHFLVGLLLLFLTIFLFLSINIYYFLNISKQDAFSSTNNKLASARGYYEQTAESVQKILNNSSKK